MIWHDLGSHTQSTSLVASSLTITPPLLRHSIVSTACIHFPIWTWYVTCICVLMTFRIENLCGKWNNVQALFFLPLFVCFIVHLILGVSLKSNISIFSTLQFSLRYPHYPQTFSYIVEAMFFLIYLFSGISPCFVAYLKYKTCTLNVV